MTETRKAWSFYSEKGEKNYFFLDISPVLGDHWIVYNSQYHIAEHGTVRWCKDFLILNKKNHEQLRDYIFRVDLWYKYCPSGKKLSFSEQDINSLFARVREANIDTAGDTEYNREKQKCLNGKN